MKQEPNRNLPSVDLHRFRRTVEVVEGEAITFAEGTIEITRITRAQGGQPKVEFRLIAGRFPRDYQIANKIFGDKQGGYYKPVTLYQQSGYTILYKAA